MVTGLWAKLIRTHSFGRNTCKTQRVGSVNQGMSVRGMRPRQERKETPALHFSGKEIRQAAIEG